MPLIVGTLMVLAFFSLALFGEQLTAASPNLTHGIMMIEGKIAAPPFRPSSVFPWGSDPVGRDVQALVLAGAKQTLALALFGTAARVFLGVTLGIIAGWWHGSWLDKLLNGTVAVWAAFPVTVFAMLLILALGIQQGMSVFVVALCVVGWGEIAQFVRGQVISLKPKPYIEAARSVGAGANRILTRHVLPHLVPSLLVLAILEMGGVLMLLAELGFLNIFLGGGFRAEIADTGRAGISFYFSDIPEWGALLSNIRAWWRSYPWLAWYPGIFFFGAILAFNLWGEGLRRLLQESRLNVSRVLNRYTLVAVGGAVLGLIWTLWNTAPLGVYRSQALQFNAQRAMEDVRVLASPDMQGRETGTPGAKRAADTIAQQMEAIGLFPGGEKNTFIQAFPCPRFHLTDVPRLEILDPQGKVAQSLAYRQDMVEYIGSFQSYGEGEGELVGVAAGPDPGTPQGQDAYGLGNLDLRDKIILIREAMATRINPGAAAGVLVVAEDPSIFQHKYLFAQQVIARPKSSPVMFISQEAAERLLVATGSNLAQLNSQAASLQPGQVALTASGARVRMSVIGMDSESPDELCYNVIGYIPGIAAAQQLDSHVIMASAYYDGLGTGPDGTLYPGANDNASGVAVMLEIARNLKRSPYQPKKTVVFVAWTRAERYESLSVSDVMSAKIGFNTLTIEAVIELSGAGAGDGKGIALGQGSSFRMVQLFQAAAERMGVATTTRGRGPHFGLPSRVGFGGRSALSAYVSWDGSDRTAHTAQDTVETIRPEKMKQVGQTTLLALMVLARETNY
jgi:peptide/nickel transport system permease protein